MAKYTARLDPILFRYLHDIVFEHAKANDPTRDYSPGEPSTRVLIDRFDFSKGEYDIISKESEKNFKDFREYFEKNRILKFRDYEEYVLKHHLNPHELDWWGLLDKSDPYLSFTFDLKLYVEVLDIDKLRKFRKDHPTLETGRIHETADNGRLIIMSNTGEFYYGTNASTRTRVDLDRNADYYKFLVAIYKSSEGNGLATLNRIANFLRDAYQLELPSNKKLKEKMQTAINKSLVKHFPSLETPTKEKIFDWRSKGPDLLFNNPKID